MFMYYIWLFLINLRQFSYPFGIPSVALTVVISALLFLNFVVYLPKNNFRITKLLLILVPYSIATIYNKEFLSMINTLLCCYLLINVKIEKIVLFNVMVLIFLFSILFMGVNLGYISNTVYNGNNGYKAGMSLWGFSNPNYASGMFFQLVILLYYLGCRYKIILLHLLCLMISIFVFKYTGGRTYFYSEIVLFVSGIFFYNHNFLEKIRPLFLLIPFLGAIYVFILASVLSDYNKYFWFDALLGGRYYHTKLYFKDFTLFNLLIGKQLPENVIIDSFYVVIFCMTGITTAMIFYFLFTKFVKNQKIRNGYMFSIVLSLLFSGFFECAFLGVTAVALPLFWLLFYKSAYGRDRILAIK